MPSVGSSNCCCTQELKKYLYVSQPKRRPGEAKVRLLNLVTRNVEQGCWEYLTFCFFSPDLSLYHVLHCNRLREQAEERGGTALRTAPSRPFHHLATAFPHQPRAHRASGLEQS